MGETTTIEIRRDQWKDLNSRKEPGDSMKDVLDRLLTEPEEAREVSVEESDAPEQRPTDGAESAHTTPQDAAQSVAMPGQGEKERKRREAFAGLLEMLRDAAPDARGGLYQATWETTEYGSAKSWRSNAAGPALSDLDDRGIVECVDPAAGEWRWTGG